MKIKIKAKKPKPIESSNQENKTTTVKSKHQEKKPTGVKSNHPEKKPKTALELNLEERQKQKQQRQNKIKLAAEKAPEATYFSHEKQHASVPKDPLKNNMLLLAKQFESMLLALKNIEALPLEVLFELQQLNQGVKRYYGRDKTISLEPELRKRLIKFFSQNISVIITPLEINQILFLLDVFSRYPRTCAEKSANNIEFQCHHHLLNNSEICIPLYKKEYAEMQEIFVDIIQNQPAFTRRISKSTESLQDNRQMFYENSVRNFMNIKTGKTMFQNEDALIDFGANCIRILCHYFIAFDVKETLFHHEHQKAETLLLLIREILFNREVPVVDRYCEIIEHLKRLPAASGFLRSLANQCLQAVKPLIPLVIHQDNLALETMRQTQVRSMQSKEEIESILQKTPYSIVTEARTLHTTQLLNSREGQVVKRQLQSQDSDSQAQPRRALDLEVLSLLIEKENQFIRFIRWFKQLFSRHSTVEKTVIKSGQFRHNGKFFSLKCPATHHACDALLDVRRYYATRTEQILLPVIATPHV